MRVRWTDQPPGDLTNIRDYTEEQMALSERTETHHEFVGADFGDAGGGDEALRIDGVDHGFGRNYCSPPTFVRRSI